MTDTPLDLSKRYRLRGHKGVRPVDLRLRRRPNIYLPQEQLAGAIEYADGRKTECFWYANGRYQSRTQDHPLDLIPCEDE